MNLSIHPATSNSTPTVAAHPIPTLADAVLSISFPQDGKLRSRKVVTRSRARATGKFPSWKMGRMVQWESPNELNAFRLLDADPTVRLFTEQPLIIEYRLRGEVHLHYPDVLVETAAGPELWEIKPAAEAAKADVAARTRFMAAALPPLGYGYRMVMAEDLQRKPRLANVLMVLKHGAKATGLMHAEVLRRVLQGTGFVCWGSATNGDLGPRGRSVLMRHVLEGRLVFDLDRPLAPATQFVPVRETIQRN